MEFDSATFSTWCLLRDQLSNVPPEKLFLAASKHVAKKSTASPTEGEIARLAKWPIGALDNMRRSDVKSLWALSCLIAVELHDVCDGDVDKAAKRVRRGLHRVQGKLSDADERLVDAAFATVSDEQPNGTIVHDVVREGAGGCTVVRFEGESPYVRIPMSQPMEVVVA